MKTTIGRARPIEAHRFGQTFDGDRREGVDAPVARRVRSLRRLENLLRASRIPPSIRKCGFVSPWQLIR